MADVLIKTKITADFVQTFIFYAFYLFFQVRDEYRTDFDGGRGGYGMIVKQKLEIPETFG